MNESDYWEHLEYRICREFAGMPENHLCGRWCDGFIPQEYQLDGQSPRITGRAWICDGPKQEEWGFTLYLNHPAVSRSEIDWASLLPPEDVTQWMGIDLNHKRIDIEPSVAIPDVKLTISAKSRRMR